MRGRDRAGRTGFLVVTPVVTDDGAVMPVNRGWAATADDPAVRPPSGEVTVTGVLQP